MAIISKQTNKANVHKSMVNEYLFDDFNRYYLDNLTCICTRYPLLLPDPPGSYFWAWRSSAVLHILINTIATITGLVRELE